MLHGGVLKMSSHFERFCRVVDERIALQKGRKPRLNVYCIAVSDFEELQNVLTRLQIEYTMLNDDGENPFVRIRMKYDDAHTSLFLNKINENGWLLIAEGGKKPAEELLRSINKQAYGCILGTYLRSDEMRSLYELFCKSLELDNYHVTSFYATRRSEVTFESETLPRATLAIWQRNAEKRFKDYENLGAYLTSLQFKGSGTKKRYSCMITRDNRVTLIEGKFSAFVKKLALPALKTGLDNLKFFRNRERKVVGGEIKIKPFEYALDSNLKESHIELLENALDDVSNYALIYRGNPYFLASCYDRKDGSVYRVSAFGKRVVIVPLNDVTESALQRLFLSLSERFREKAPQEYIRVDEKPWVPISSR
jgi:hypothetical protein